jgi:hypothetical protein
VAALHRVTGGVVTGLRSTSLAGRAHGIAAAVSQGQGARAFAALPAGARRVAAEVTRSAFTSGLNEILVVSGVGALLARRRPDHENDVVRLSAGPRRAGTCATPGSSAPRGRRAPRYGPK